jgi:hypothetical protein
MNYGSFLKVKTAKASVAGRRNPTRARLDEKRKSLRHQGGETQMKIADTQEQVLQQWLPTRV